MYNFPISALSCRDVATGREVGSFYITTFVKVKDVSSKHSFWIYKKKIVYKIGKGSFLAVANMISGDVL